MKALDTRRVLLAGLAGVVEASGSVESARIAEILGVRVYREGDAEAMPEADLLIYGEPAGQYRALGARLGMRPDQMWDENEAWEILTRDAADEASAPTEKETPADADADPEVAHQPDRTAEADAQAPPWPRELRPVTRPVDVANEAPVPDSAYAALNAFARACGSLEELYGWILGHAIAETQAAAGGVAPVEPVRPLVWRDRRETPKGEMPAFLRPDASGKEVLTVPLGKPGSPGAGRLVLMGPSGEASSDVSRFADAVTPALRVVAELEDLRRQKAWDGVVRKLVTSLEQASSPETALSETCVALAETLGARECALLFLTPAGDALKGHSSEAAQVAYPAGSGVFAKVLSTGQPLRLSDHEGVWHYHVPFGSDPQRGVLALFGVSAAPGSVESVGHQACALADALASHFPQGAWQG
jgi:hypothetical protein